MIIRAFYTNFKGVEFTFYLDTLTEKAHKETRALQANVLMCLGAALEVDQIVPSARKSTKVDFQKGTRHVFEGDISMVQFFKIKQKPQTTEQQQESLKMLESFSTFNKCLLSPDVQVQMGSAPVTQV